MAKREPNYHGLLIVDKPGKRYTGFETTPEHTSLDLPTSHDIVQMARRWCKQRRIGHTGTLDPMASGVLVLCLGKATRLVEYYQRHNKQYLADICLGLATDTYDAMGQVAAKSNIPKLHPDDLEAVFAEFRGEILQTPPLYSAIKQGGESLHRKARRGEIVRVVPRQVTFHRIDLVDFVPPERIQIRVLCSAGAYIRSLAHDLGQALGTTAYLDRLRREAAGPFTLKHAHSPDEIAQSADAGTLKEKILPLGSQLSMPTINLSPLDIRSLGYGQSVIIHLHELDKAGPDSLVAVYDQSNSDFAGIIRYVGLSESPRGGSIWKAEKWFVNHQ